MRARAEELLAESELYEAEHPISRDGRLDGGPERHSPGPGVGIGLRPVCISAVSHAPKV
jgi:hypothetical protein